MKNPVAKTREQLGLSRRHFALVARIGYAELWRGESGYARSLHPQLIQFLKRSGYAGDPEKDYEQWREEVGNGIQASVSGAEIAVDEGSGRTSVIHGGSGD